MEELPGQGEVIFLRFPYSDLKGYKNRPALVLTPLERDDMLVCGITSQPYTDPRAIVIREGDFAEGRLPLASYVRPMKMFTAHRSIVTRRNGRLKAEVVNRVLDRIVDVLRGAES